MRELCQNSLDHTFKKTLHVSLYFKSVSSHAHTHIEEEEGGGWWGRLFAFQLIRKRKKNSRVMSFLPNRLRLSRSGEHLGAGMLCLGCELDLGGWWVVWRR